LACQGIIGAVSYAVATSEMLLQSKHIEENDSDTQAVISVLEMTHKQCQPHFTWNGLYEGEYAFSDNGVPLSFFFDELSLAVQGCSLAPTVSEWIREQYAHEYVTATTLRTIHLLSCHISFFEPHMFLNLIYIWMQVGALPW